MCPGCDNFHAVQTTDAPDGTKTVWTFNDSLSSPTFFPSLLYKDDGEVCHSNVSNGLIHFHGDSTHKLRNQTVPLLEIA
ncbi:MAG: DUF6527 family protein [Deltaproteobacteria bacterium]